MKKSPIFALLLLALPVAAQDLEISPVAGPIHMISGRGGNIGVSAGADGFLMIVAAGLKAGKSLEELQAAGVGEEWASWSWGFISTKRWVATLHRSQ